MEFLIGRASVKHNEKPHKRAYKREVTYTDIRGITKKDLMADKEKWEYWGKEWYETGENHREENREIMRELKKQRWAIEVEDVIEFMEEVQSPILLSGSNYPEVRYAIGIDDE